MKQNHSISVAVIAFGIIASAVFYLTNASLMRLSIWIIEKTPSSLQYLDIGEIIMYSAYAGMSLIFHLVPVILVIAGLGYLGTALMRQDVASVLLLAFVVLMFAAKEYAIVFAVLQGCGLWGSYKGLRAFFQNHKNRKLAGVSFEPACTDTSLLPFEVVGEVDRK